MDGTRARGDYSRCVKLTHPSPTVETTSAPLLATPALSDANQPVATAPAAVAEAQPTARPGIHERNLRKWLFQH
jgi:hypothetical protein